MRYLPLTTAEREKILKLCGAKDFNDLTQQVPDELRLKSLLDLEAPLSESEVTEHLRTLSKKNTAGNMVSFLGHGAYDHSWPTVVDQITNRGEFLTAYTPYQPEISQGTLQAIFEYQSMIAELTGMEVANASLYDGGTAAVEGVLMAARLQNLRAGRVLVSEGLYPRTREVLESYLIPLGFTLETWRADPKTLTMDGTPARGDGPVVALLAQSPNAWGLVEDWRKLSSAARELGSKSVALVAHAHSLAIYNPPGSANVDIVTGEGQSFGVPVGFGGPYLGLFACRKADVRQMPGRLVGATVDSRGEPAYCVTLSTREQHIRREKATSNICSNQNLMAMRACIYLTLMGPEGLRKVALLSRSKAHYARTRLREALAQSAPDLRVVDGEIFNEVAVLVPAKRNLWLDEALKRGEDRGILAGVRVSVPGTTGMSQALTLAFTEHHKQSDIDRLVAALCDEPDNLEGAALRANSGGKEPS